MGAEVLQTCRCLHQELEGTQAAQPHSKCPMQGALARSFSCAIDRLAGQPAKNSCGVSLDPQGGCLRAAGLSHLQ